MHVYEIFLFPFTVNFAGAMCSMYCVRNNDGLEYIPMEFKFKFTIGDIYIL